ncbi:MAG: hypothetical protein H6935_09365 [Thiobacillus sp.]|nr:hypothetical protein [Thiobacillus sp.]
MDLISDPDRFEDAIRALRELAAEGQAYRRGGSLDHLLEGLIGAALSEFGPDKFDMPRRAGDLADADGIRHLLADYGPAFLNAREEAAASLALKLFLARDFLKLGFGLPDETIREIEGTGRTLLSWRQDSRVHTLEPLAERGQAELDRLADMRERAAGESTIYSEQAKEDWRAHDTDQTPKAARKLNQADRIRSVLTKFKLPESAYRTVSRALFGR